MSTKARPLRLFMKYLSVIVAIFLAYTAWRYSKGYAPLARTSPYAFALIALGATITSGIEATRRVEWSWATSAIAVFGTVVFLSILTVIVAHSML